MNHCDVCKEETLISIDLWVQGFHHYEEDDLLAKSFEINRNECGGVDYISVCPGCWIEKLKTIWAQMVVLVKKEE